MFYKKIILIIFLFLFIFPSNILADKSKLINKLNNKNILKKEVKSNLTLQQEKAIVDNKKIQKQSFEELKASQKIPDLIISVDSSKVKDQEIDVLVSKLDNLKKQGKKIDYFTDDKLVGVYINLYGSEEKYKELKEQLVYESIKISPNRKLVKQYTPNDTDYSSQWNLANISWSQAMDISAGSNQVIIGIIDNGVDVDDLDLSTNIWQNSGEIYGDNIDNDGNGYIDDKYGCDFAKYIIYGLDYIACEKERIKEELDLDSKHGTYVAQTATGVTNNSLGIAGVCPNCKIAVLKISAYGNIYGSLLPYVFSYAIDKGFKVLNLSMGNSCPFDASEDIYASDINTLINTYGVMLVQAAGNNGAMTQSQCISQCGSSNFYCYNSDRNKAYYYVEGKNVSNKINVASINSSNQRSSWSVYDGSNTVISIAAPGESIPVYPYQLVNGTSFSAPTVSGALGFMLTRYNKDQSKLYNSLIYSADTISTDYNISGRKLNLYKAIHRFPDVITGDTFYTYIENLARDGVINGYPDGLFRPNDNVTRGAMAKFIKNAYSFSTNTSCGDFPDVPPSHTFYEFITTLKCAGVIQGYPDGYFRPEENVSRGAAMKFVINGLRKKRGDDNYLRYYGSDTHFPDLSPTHTFYEFVMSAWSNGIVNGYPDGYFRPDETTSRGAMSKMVDNGRTKL